MDEQEYQVMNGTEYIEKNLRKKRNYFISLTIFIVFLVAGFFLLQHIEGKSSDFMIFYSLVFLFGFFIYPVIYFTKIRPFSRSYKRLISAGNEHIADDINLEINPTFPHSKIYCGQKALISQKNRVILPYAEIGLAYAYDVNVHETAGVFYMKDGSKFTIDITYDEFSALIKMIRPKSPGLLVGQEAKYEFSMKCPEARIHRFPGKKIGAGFLLLFGITGLISNFLRNSFTFESIFIISLSLVAGIALLYTDSKGKK